MRSLTLTEKRILSGVYLAGLVTCGGSYYLDWNLFGGLDKKVLALVILIGVVAAHRYGPGLLVEMEAYRAKKQASRGGNV